MADLLRARMAKKILSEWLDQIPEIIGIGLVQHSGTWIIKVNLQSPTPHLNLPSCIHGVEIITDVTGPILARDSTEPAENNDTREIPRIED